jgi:glycosyltransferase involved in cell wall biosynthesis
MNQEKEGSHKIRILHLVHSLGMGGAEVLLIQYIKSLGMKDYAHFVYFFGSDGPVRKKIEALGIPVHMGKRMALIKQPIRFIAHLLSLLRDLMTFIKSSRIQLIQSHLSHANKLAVLVGKLAGVPAFPTIHNTMEFVDRRSRWDFRVYINKAVDWFIFPMADQIVAVSQEVKDIVHQRFRVKNSKIMVLKNGIVFDNSFYDPVDLEKEFIISENTLKIIAVGRLTYQKAMEVLVRAAAELLSQGLHDFFVMIAGEGEERIGLENLIRDLKVENNIKLLGIRHDVIGLMKASDIFVMPSRYEGLSIAMIEAMACGLSIVASDAPGLKTYIIQGKNGLLFPVEDHKAMAKCILQLAEDRNMRDRLSLAARESFEKEYNMRKNIKSLDMLSRQLCKDKK